MEDKIEAIRARHEACGHIDQWPDYDSFMAHTDRATLLRLMDAAREELAEERAKLTKIRKAVGPVLLEARLMASQAAQREVWKDAEWVANSSVGQAVTRLAAALKAPPTRAQGESS